MHFIYPVYLNKAGTEGRPSTVRFIPLSVLYYVGKRYSRHYTMLVSSDKYVSSIAFSTLVNDPLKRPKEISMEISATYSCLPIYTRHYVL